MNTNELASQLEQKRGELKSLFDSFKDSDGKLNIPSDKLGEVEQRNTELKELNDSYLAAKSAEIAEAENTKALEELKTVNRLPIAGIEDAQPAALKSLGESIVESGALKALGQSAEVDFDFKTVFSTGAGYAPFSPRDNVVAAYPNRQLNLLDVIPTMSWGAASYLFMEETTFTPTNAVEKAESADGALVPYGEVAIAYTERSVTMRDIGAVLPVTEVQLEDVPGLTNLLNDRLAYMVRRRFEGQLVAGDGNAPNIKGILNVTNIQTQAKGSDDVPTAIHKAITKVRTVGFAEPTHILMHPNDWEGIRLLQLTTGGFIADGGMNFAGAMSLFGIPVILSTAVTENTAIVIDLSYFSAIVRRGMSVELARSGDDFKNRMLTIRADMRGNLACYRGYAACKVSGI